MLLFDLVCHLFLKLSTAGISENLSIFWAACLALAPPVGFCGRIETEQQNDQDEDEWRHAHGRKIARARMASRTPSNGLVMANQKETFQPVSWMVEFIFTLFSQAFEDRHFTKS